MRRPTLCTQRYTETFGHNTATDPTTKPYNDNLVCGHAPNKDLTTRPDLTEEHGFVVVSIVATTEIETTSCV